MTQPLIETPFEYRRDCFASLAMTSKHLSLRGAKQRSNLDQPDASRAGSALAQRHLEAALRPRPRHHRLVPALDVGIVGEVDLMALVPPGPAEDGEIGDRHLRAGGIRHLAQPLVEDAVEPARLLHVALEAVAAVRLLLDLQEMVHLSGDRPEPAHLPHQPFEHRHLAAQIALRPELAGLLAEINQDRAGFEDADRPPARPVAVDDRRDLAVRADPDEVGLELLALADM